MLALMGGIEAAVSSSPILLVLFLAGFAACVLLAIKEEVGRR